MTYGKRVGIDSVFNERDTQRELGSVEMGVLNRHRKNSLSFHFQWQALFVERGRGSETYE